MFDPKSYLTVKLDIPKSTTRLKVATTRGMNPTQPQISP
jgi:hypothetical protein